MAKRPAPPVTRGIMSDSPSSLFWEGFWQGFGKASVIGLIATMAFVIGLTLGSWSHPYEVCKRMYDSPEGVSECMWIRMNP